ncbi:hypothetical protein UFOVP234_1, partial [uncultured Caudovirales phage]
MIDQDDNDMPDMDGVEENEDGSADVTLPDDFSDVTELPDGSAIVNSPVSGPEESPDFYENMAETMDSYELDSLAMRYI